MTINDWKSTIHIRFVSTLSSDGGEGQVSLKLVSKWGFDGSSNHARYKMTTTGDFTDGSIVLTSLVPLQLSKVRIYFS